MKTLILGMIFMLLSCGNILAISLDEIPDITENYKIRYLSQLWKEVDYNYPHFDQLEDFNWDEVYIEHLELVRDTDSLYDFYRVLQRFLATLEDCNTRIVLPPAISNNLSYPLIQLQEIEEKIIITNIGKKYSEIIPIGSELIMIDNRPVNEYLEQEVAPYISASNESVLRSKSLLMAFLGIKGTEIPIKVDTPQGETATTEVTLDWEGDSWSEFMWQKEKILHNWLDEEEEIVHIEMNRFNDPKIHDFFDRMLKRIKDAKGAVIDLRQNDQGNIYIAYDMLKHFSEAEKLPFALIKSRKHVPLYYALGSGSAWYGIQPNQDYIDYGLKEAWVEKEPTFYDNDPEKEKFLTPLVILIGEKTTTPAEDFAWVLQELRDDVILVGSNTSGRRGQAVIEQLPTAGQAWITTSKDFLPDGTVISKVGLEPDVKIEQTYEDYLNDKDTVLEEGHRILRELIDR